VLVLATLGIFQLGVPCMLLVFISRTLTAPEIALLALLEVVLGPLWAWLGAGEVPAGTTLIGGAIVIAALAGNEAAALAERRRTS
jgi:drug/metabolite transporter (DMT)-like permease